VVFEAILAQRLRASIIVVAGFGFGGCGCVSNPTILLRVALFGDVAVAAKKASESGAPTAYA